MVDKEHREREGGKRVRERVMVTFIPSRDHQKRASKIALTHYLPHQRGDGGLTHSTASQFTRDTEKWKCASNKQPGKQRDDTSSFYLHGFWSRQRGRLGGENHRVQKKNKTKGWTSPLCIRLLVKWGTMALCTMRILANAKLRTEQKFHLMLLHCFHSTDSRE